MQTTTSWQANLLLLTTAMIWGFAFVAQRLGMEHVSPFTFNATRFLVGAVSLLPVLILYRLKKPVAQRPRLLDRFGLLGGICLGVVLFLGSSLQQIGIVYTTAGKAGFITGLYVIIVPLLGLLWKQRTGMGTWMGALLAVVGMYFLSITDGFNISHGDLLVLVSALFWAIHVQLISWFTQRFDSLLLSLYQFLFCALLSWLAALQWETISISAIRAAMYPILYAGIISVGIAYTLQVVAQQKAHPAHAAIILSLESVFALLGGWLFLGEILSPRGLFGCALMLVGMILSQLLPERRRKSVSYELT
ncbi:MAG: DMT family transporter [Proteobacteria bacterium]|nr:DMT family transporter [Pseudomonadota bacterium]MBU1455989.1 DMT family transporter [Pseudomonadota bacterium]